MDLPKRLPRIFKKIFHGPLAFRAQRQQRGGWVVPRSPRPLSFLRGRGETIRRPTRWVASVLRHGKVGHCRVRGRLSREVLAGGTSAGMGQHASPRAKAGRTLPPQDSYRDERTQGFGGHGNQDRGGGRCFCTLVRERWGCRVLILPTHSAEQDQDKPTQVCLAKIRAALCPPEEQRRLRLPRTTV